MKNKIYKIIIYSFLVICLFLLFTGFTVEAQTIGSDKILHFIVSFSIEIASYELIDTIYKNNDLFNDNSDTYFYLKLMFSSFLSFIPGLLKEVYDSTKSDNFFDFYDLVADILGILFADLFFYMDHLDYSKENNLFLFKNSINSSGHTLFYMVYPSLDDRYKKVMFQFKIKFLF